MSEGTLTVVPPKKPAIKFTAVFVASPDITVLLPPELLIPISNGEKLPTVMKFVDEPGYPRDLIT